MKKLILVALSVAALVTGASAAEAQRWHHGGHHGYHRGYNHRWGHGPYHRRGYYYYYYYRHGHRYHGWR